MTAVADGREILNVCPLVLLETFGPVPDLLLFISFPRQQLSSLTLTSVSSYHLQLDVVILSYLLLASISSHYLEIAATLFNQLTKISVSVNQHQLSVIMSQLLLTSVMSHWFHLVRITSIWQSYFFVSLRQLPLSSVISCYVKLFGVSIHLIPKA